jgi:hypothetical protein
MKFAMNTNGYNEAKAYLISIGEWENASTRGFSVDGYSVVQFANSCWEKNEK